MSLADLFASPLDEIALPDSMARRVAQDLGLDGVIVIGLHRTRGQVGLATYAKECEDEPFVAELGSSLLARLPRRDAPGVE